MSNAPSWVAVRSLGSTLNGGVVLIVYLFAFYSHAMQRNTVGSCITDFFHPPYTFVTESRRPLNDVNHSSGSDCGDGIHVFYLVMCCCGKHYFVQNLLKSQYQIIKPVDMSPNVWA